MFEPINIVSVIPSIPWTNLKCLHVNFVMILWNHLPCVLVRELLKVGVDHNIEDSVGEDGMDGLGCSVPYL